MNGSGETSLEEQAKNNSQPSYRVDGEKGEKEREKQRRKRRRWIRVGIPVVLLVSFVACLLGCHRGEVKDAESILSISAPMSKHVEVPYKRNPYGKKLVALTFDDGPYPDTTNRLLDVLREKEVQATFFELGTMASRYPEVTKRVYDEKHELASHTMSHKQLNKLSAGEVESEVERARDVIEDITGEEPELVRPPYGALNNTVRDKIGAPMILWTVDTEDWKSKDADSVLERTKDAVFDGAVILMHDIYGSTVDAVGMVIDELRKDNYEFVTVSELAEIRGVELKNGEAYGSFRP